MTFTSHNHGLLLSCLVPQSASDLEVHDYTIFFSWSLRWPVMAVTDLPLFSSSCVLTLYYWKRRIICIDCVRSAEQYPEVR
ncbi:hypothetical protein L209DRAFT_757980, partial [Thermothelomyces heterothallicus CBS 203.75]